MERSTTLSVEPVRPPKLWEAVLEQLRNAILGGELAPGTKLIETELAARFDTSRGPVRQAIRELLGEGLIVELSRRGTVVSTLTARDLTEVYAVREALEVGAGAVAIERATDGELAALEQHLTAMEEAWRVGADYLATALDDMAFHRGLVALAGNGRMAAMNEQMLLQTQLLLRSAAEGNPTLQGGMRHSAHRDIHAALLAHDAAALRTAIEVHYRYAEERLFAGPETPSAD